MLKKTSYIFFSFLFYFFAFPLKAWSLDIEDITLGVLDVDFNWDITQPSNSTYFEPLVEISLNVCVEVNLYLISFRVCIPTFANGSTLDPHGECRFMIPFPIRACARMYHNGSSDPPPAPRYDTTKSLICVYNDPMFPIDPNDFNPGRMKHPHNTRVERSFTNPIELGTNSAVMLGAGAITGVGPAALGGYLAYEGIKNLVNLIGSTINYTVISNLGCVGIPFGPMPPFYTNTLPLSPRIPFAFNVCQKDASGRILMPGVSSASDAFCEFGSMHSSNSASPSSLPANKFNTHENPSIIMSFKNILPKCDAPDETGRIVSKKVPCVDVYRENTYTLYATNYMNNHTNNLGNDLLIPLKNCEDLDYNDPGFCIRNMEVKSENIGKLFRPVCDVRTRDGKFAARKVQCSLILLGGATNITEITGIDYSNFYQVPIFFNKGESIKETTPLAITDMEDAITSNITLKAEARNPNKIEIFQKFDNQAKNKIGSFIRPEMPKPVVTSPSKAVDKGGREISKTSCSANSTNCLYIDDINFISTHTNPAIGFALGTPMQNDYIVYSALAGLSTQEKYLYLNKFKVSITDKNNSNSINIPTVYGKYRKKGSLNLLQDVSNDILQTAVQTKTTPDNTEKGRAEELVYMEGIEMVDGKYIRGGDYICLEGYNNPEKVLTIKKGEFGSAVLSERVFPPYQEGQTDLGNEKFVESTFKTEGANTTLDTMGSLINPNSSNDIERYSIRENQVIRNKVPLESGLCVPIPQPKCLRKTEKTAIWETTNFGKDVIQGRCLSTSRSIPKRFCQLKSDDYNVAEWSEIIGKCDIDWWPSISGSGQFIEFPDKKFSSFNMQDTTKVMVMTDDLWSQLLDSSSEENLFVSLKNNHLTQYYLNLSKVLSNTPLYDYMYGFGSEDYKRNTNSPDTILLSDYININDTSKYKIYVRRHNSDLQLHISIEGKGETFKNFPEVFSAENIAKFDANN